MAATTKAMCKAAIGINRQDRLLAGFSSTACWPSGNLPHRPDQPTRRPERRNLFGIRPRVRAAFAPSEKSAVPLCAVADQHEITWLRFRILLLSDGHRALPQILFF